MRLTKRCWELLRLLRAARWLATGQVHRRFFPQASADVVRKRLRKLVAAGYLARYRTHAMSESLFRLGPQGKRTLAESGLDGVTLERQPPRQLEHFLGINDVRIAAELTGCLSYYFACWELPGLGWSYPIIPDAVFALGDRTLALEFDRGLESVRFFKQTKLPAYRGGFDGLSIAAVLMVAVTQARMESLARSIGSPQGLILFTTIELVRSYGLLAPVFRQQGGACEGSLKSLLSGCLDDKRVSRA